MVAGMDLYQRITANKYTFILTFIGRNSRMILMGTTYAMGLGMLVELLRIIELGLLNYFNNHDFTYLLILKYIYTIKEKVEIHNIAKERIVKGLMKRNK